ncbi:MAG: hypothetical protein NXH75_11940 [Halobacteriovoraceae bacterium]|nr:hypothetical protein [Halobacteriovoraceae bacterium]
MTLSRGIVVVLMFFPALFFMGLLVPAFVDERIKDFNVLALNSWGNVVGIFAFVTLLTIGLETKFLLILISILFFSVSFFKKEKMGLINSVIILVFVLLIPTVFFHFSFRFYESPYLFWSSLKKGKIVQSKNLFGGQVDILDLPKGKTLIIDGYKSVLLKNAISDSSPESLLGKYQEKLVKNKKDALILGVGSGATVVSLAQTFENVVGVEIHPVIYKIKDFFDVGFQDLKKFKNTSIVFDDGFNYLSSTSQKYDLIVNNVPTPQLSAASTLWTRDFYQIVKNHLKKDGAYSQWIDGAINREAILVILKTLQGEFEECYLALVTSTYGNLVCFKEKNVFKLNVLDDPIFSIENWQNIKFPTYPNSLDRPMLEYSLNPMLSKAWTKKKDWFLLELLKVSPTENLKETCRSLKLVKTSKGGGLPPFCLE